MEIALAVALILVSIALLITNRRLRTIAMICRFYERTLYTHRVIIDRLENELKLLRFYKNEPKIDYTIHCDKEN